ncbi:unnamed protein product [Phytophthora fragariaefolia]|uniref:Unnamed protein product n=1 Tax=Phytophthora fragariaefolia TaxID=1490495 RepID=A0A9W7D9C1_9STRA|nr:unnamed protein product [Phytophthora fragariaefolia]
MFTRGDSATAMLKSLASLPVVTPCCLAVGEADGGDALRRDWYAVSSLLLVAVAIDGAVNEADLLLGRQRLDDGVDLVIAGAPGDGGERVAGTDELRAERERDAPRDGYHGGCPVCWCVG